MCSDIKQHAYHPVFRFNIDIESIKTFVECNSLILGKYQILCNERQTTIKTSLLDCNAIQSYRYEMQNAVTEIRARNKILLLHL